MTWKIFVLSLASYSLFAIHCSQPVAVSDLREDAKAPSVAINAHGDGVVAWIGKERFQESIRATVKDSKGGWSYPIILSEERESMSSPQCYFGDDGEAYVFWTRWNYDVEYRQKSKGHDWTGPIPLNVKLDRYCDLVFDGKKFLFLHDNEEKGLFLGKSVTAQVHIKQGDYESILTPPGAEHGWFDNEKRSRGQAIGINPLGDTFVIWRRDVYLDALFQGSWLLPDGSFTETEELADQLGFLDSFISGIAIDDQKNVAVVGVKKNKIQALTRINGEWSDWIPLSEEDEKKGSWCMPRPQVAVDSRGNILAVWKTEREGAVYIDGAYKAINQEWTFLDRITAEGKVDKIILRSDHKDAFVVVWAERKDRRNSGIYAVEFSDKQGMSPIHPLSPTGEFCSEPALEFSKEGQGILAWTKKASNFDSCIEVVELSFDR
jgi:hypothetical protein